LKEVQWIAGSLPNAILLLNLDAKSFELRSLDQLGSHGFTVSSLSNFMPEDLALKYGTLLGLE
jgi:hypothetical protein